MSRNALASILAAAALALPATPAHAETAAKPATPVAAKAATAMPPVSKAATSTLPLRTEFILSGGWGGRIPNTGHVDSWLMLPGDTFRASNGFNALVTQATVDFTVIPPWELATGLRPLMQIGGTFAIGDAGRTGDVAGIPGTTGLVQAEIEQDNIFDLMFGVDYAIPCQTLEGPVSFRPMVGFEVANYTNRLWINETAFLNPLTSRPFPLITDTTSQTSVNPVLGLQVTFPIYNPIASPEPGQVAPWSVHARMSGAYAFDVSGDLDQNRMTPGGFPAGSSVNPGDQIKVGAAIELRFNSSLLDQGIQARYVNFTPR